MPYKVIDIYKDLPKTNCRDCGKPGCFAFASSVFLEHTPLADCPHLDERKLSEMQAKLDEERGEETGESSDKAEQAVTFLLGKIKDLDLKTLARNAGGRLIEGQPEKIELDFLGIPHEITKEDVVAVGNEEPSQWVKTFLLYYAIHATGKPEAGEWAALKEFPNSGVKAQTFEKIVNHLAEHFTGNIEGFCKMAEALGGEKSGEDADAAYRFQILPRVKILALFWDADEDFDARVSVLLDKNIMDYLDLETTNFMTEAFVNVMMGKSHLDVVP